MGSILFDPRVLIDTLSETAGYKAGLALSFDNICEHLDDTGHAEILRISETQMVRIRSEEYEDLFYKLLHRIGYTEEEYNGDIVGVGLFHKYRGTEKEEQHLGVLELFAEIWPELIEQTLKSGSKAIDPGPLLRACANKFGKVGLEMAIERLECFNKAIKLSPHTVVRYTEWENIEVLDSLFQNGQEKPKYCRYFDQRFIDYLSNNPDKIDDMNWRKFEELTAEYFHKSGFNVELGPGQNDDGVDVRVWKDSQDSDSDAPHIIIQCKRQKQKIEKVIIKGLYADVQHEQADYGLIVTSSELSPGARKTIQTRGYPIEEINKKSLHSWLKELRTPGSGIVRF